MREISAGLMQPWEYRVRWYGEDEATARRSVASGAVATKPTGREARPVALQVANRLVGGGLRPWVSAADAKG